MTPLTRPTAPRTSRTPRARQRTALLAGALTVTGVLAAACGSSGSSSADPPSPAAPAPSPSGTSAAPVASGSPSTTTPPAASAAPASATPGSCATGQLTTTVGGGSGAAGSLYTAVVFVNAGSTTCTLDGHPGVSMVVGDAGQQLGAPAQRTGTPALVSLAPGATAHAVLRVVQAQDYSSSDCSPQAATGFRVYPPDQTASAFVPFVITGCADTSVMLLTISPVEPGAPTP